jgi:hypothetical protein
MDNLLDAILGRKKNRRDDGIVGDLLGTVGRWVRTCGCLFVLALAGVIVAIAMGVIKLTNDQITIVIVFITMVVATASLIRTSTGY